MTAIMKNQPTPPDREVLTGLVERVTYQNAENGFYPRAILLSAASAARSPASQAPPTVPHKVSCAASPANQRRSRSGSASALRAHCPPEDAAENAPSTQGSLFQRVACVRLTACFTSEP